MYHTTSDGKMYLPNAELPGQNVELVPDEARTIMAGRNYNAFEDRLRTEQANRDKPVPIENPQKLEGASPYNVIRAEKQGDMEYHYVDKLPLKPYSESEINDFANSVGKFGGAVTGAITGANSGAGLARWLGPEAVPWGAGAGAIYGGISGYKEGPEATRKHINSLTESGFTLTKSVQQEGNKIFIVNTPPREF